MPTDQTPERRRTRYRITFSESVIVSYLPSDNRTEDEILEDAIEQCEFTSAMIVKLEDERVI